MSIYDQYKNHETLEIALLVENDEPLSSDLCILAAKRHFALTAEDVLEYISPDPATRFGVRWSPVSHVDLQKVDWDVIAETIREAAREADAYHREIGERNLAHGKLRFPMRTVTLEDDVANILQQLEIEALEDGTFATHLPPKLDTKLYRRVSDLLSYAGVAWSRAKQAHISSADPTARIERILATNGHRGRIKKPYDYGFFATPSALADDVVSRIRLPAGARVLEPGIGTGSLSDAVLRKYPDAEIHGYEISEERHAEITQRYANISLGDFMSVEPEPIYDAVVMNPPFERGQDIAHIKHATQFLKPGGSMSAIASAGVLFNSSKAHTEFREWIAEMGGVIEPHPEGSFASSGTGVRTVSITFVRPALELELGAESSAVATPAVESTEINPSVSDISLLVSDMARPPVPPAPRPGLRRPVAIDTISATAPASSNRAYNETELADASLETLPAAPSGYGQQMSLGF